MLIAGIALLGAFLAVGLKNVFYNALSLILCLFGVAGLFIFLNSEFLAIIEVIVYIGAISVAIIFAIMLSQPMLQRLEPRNPAKLLRSFLIAALGFAALFETIRTTQWPAPAPGGDYSLAAVGRSLLTTNVLPFEAVSVVLLVAIIGALLLSSSKDTSG
jgi:NADH-quinone oxidoreductase subunit J